MGKTKKDKGVSLKPLTFEQAIIELGRPKLEDYEPGASQSQVFSALIKVAKSPKTSTKHT